MSIVWTDTVTPLNAANMNLLEQTPRKGQANGYAALDAGVKVPVAQLPAGVASGVASLDSGGKVPITGKLFAVISSWTGAKLPCRKGFAGQAGFCARSTPPSVPDSSPAGLAGKALLLTVED